MEQPTSYTYHQGIMTSKEGKKIAPNVEATANQTGIVTAQTVYGQSCIIVLQSKKYPEQYRTSYYNINNKQTHLGIATIVFEKK